MLSLRRGPGDPTHRRVGNGWLRASRTPTGPVLIMINQVGTAVRAKAWGDGAEWALDQLPRLVGEADAADGFVPRPEHGPLVAGPPALGPLPGRPDRRGVRGAGRGLHRAGGHRQGGVPGLAAAGPRVRRARARDRPPSPASAAYGMRVPPTPQAWAQVPAGGSSPPGWSSAATTSCGPRSGPPALERTLADPAAADRALQASRGGGVDLGRGAAAGPRRRGRVERRRLPRRQGHHLRADRRGAGRRRLHRSCWSPTAGTGSGCRSLLGLAGLGTPPGAADDPAHPHPVRDRRPQLNPTRVGRSRYVVVGR